MPESTKIVIASPGLDSNDASAGRLKMFLTQFAGEVLTAYRRKSVTAGDTWNVLFLLVKPLISLSWGVLRLSTWPLVLIWMICVSLASRLK